MATQSWEEEEPHCLLRIRCVTIRTLCQVDHSPSPSLLLQLNRAPQSPVTPFPSCGQLKTITCKMNNTTQNFQVKIKVHENIRNDQLTSCGVGGLAPLKKKKYPHRPPPRPSPTHHSREMASQQALGYGQGKMATVITLAYCPNPSGQFADTIRPVTPLGLRTTAPYLFLLLATSPR